MIYDCFLFLDEYDLLEIRLATLYNHVDKFVITESNRTFSGKEKQYNYARHENRFKQYADKIIYNACPAMRVYSDPWKNEFSQRDDTICNHKLKLFDDDVIMVSDVDEIPDPYYLDILRYGNHVVELNLKWYQYKLNYEMMEEWRPGVKITTVEHIKKYYGGSAQKLRSENNSKHRIYSRAGWHFSYCCDIKSKLDSYSHQENNTQQIRNDMQDCIDNMTVFWDTKRTIMRVSMDHVKNEYLIANRKQYTHLIGG